MSAPSCSNCLHQRTYGRYYPPMCQAPHLNDGMSTGNMVAMQRSDGWLMARWNGTCGKEGRFFQQRQDWPLRDASKDSADDMKWQIAP